MRRSLVLLALAAASPAQTPDVRVRGDVTGSVVFGQGNASTFRLYSPLGRHSTVGLAAYLENGLVATISERLQLFSGDADDELLDEYTVEDPGIWRVGKQYLPFGAGTLLRESVRAVRADTNLILEGVPIVVAAYDGGAGRPRGVMGRIGPRSYGLSVSIGRSIGVSGTALPIVRSPEGSPGAGGGWDQAFGGDVSYRVGATIYRAEGLLLRDGTAGEPDRALLDLSFTRDLRRRDSITGEAILDLDRRQTFLRLSGLFGDGRGLFLEPLVILRGLRVDRAGAGLRYRF